MPLLFLHCLNVIAVAAVFSGCLAIMCHFNEKSIHELKIQLQVQSSQQQATTAVTIVSSSVAPITTPSSLKVATNIATAGVIPSPVTKPALKVSFKERIKALQHEDTKKSVAQEKERKTSDDKELLLPNASAGGNGGSSTSSETVSKSISKPSTLIIKEKIKLLGQQSSGVSIKSDDLTPTSSLRPWSKLKLATVVGSRTSSYTSLNNSVNEGSPPGPQSIKIVKIGPTPSASTASTSDNVDAVKPIWRVTTEHEKKRIPARSSDRICTSDSEIKNAEIVRLRSKLKSRVCRVHGEPKNYRSVDDLSPEYCGLPFVKKLKILNERQKLAELESAIQTTRSFSLDYPDTSTDNEPFEPLIRSHSEGSGMTRPKVSTITPTSTAIVPVAPLNVPQCLHSPVSPESNETAERRQLKSILKKLSEEKNGASGIAQKQNCEQLIISQQFNESDDLKSLLRAPTVEGYVARHSKFVKSVTFNSTLSSPPTSAHSVTEAIEERSLFPLLSAQPSSELSPITPHSREPSQPVSPQSQSNNSFLLDDSTNSRLQDTSDEQVQSEPIQSLKIQDDVSPKESTNPFVSKRFLKGNYRLPLQRIHFVSFLALVFLFHTQCHANKNE